MLAEHVCTGSPLADIVRRLGMVDKSELAAEAITVEAAAMALRDLAAPRRSDSESPPVTDRSGPPTHTSILNRYAGKCVCTRWVPEGMGRAVRLGDKWQTFCRNCATEKGYAK